MAITCLVEVATGAFIVDGSQTANGSTYIRYSLPSSPDPRTQKYSGNHAAPFTAKTAQEIATYDALKSDAAHNLRFVRDYQALAGALFKAQTGNFPNASQKASLKADFITAWKALG